MCTFAIRNRNQNNLKMKRRLIAVMMLALTALTATTAQEKSTVILTAGQSNAAGRADNATLPNYIQTLGTENGGTYQYCQWSYTNGGSRKQECEGCSASSGLNVRRLASSLPSMPSPTTGWSRPCISHFTW